MSGKALRCHACVGQCIQVHDEPGEKVKKAGFKGQLLIMQTNQFTQSPQRL
jgi:hypothetical protein